MKRFAVFVFLLSLSLVSCARQTISGERMADANRLYEAGQFAEAAAGYQALVDSGVEDGRLYYNLGNAYFKAGDLGRAILNYRRAQRLLPRDADVATNLQLARAQAIDRLESETEGALVGFVRRLLVEWTTQDEVTAIAMGLWALLCALVVTALLWPRGRRGLTHAIVVVTVLLGLSVLSTGIRVLDERGSHPAVVAAAEVSVRSGPGTDYLAEFTLHTGAEVRVLEERDDWVRIALPGNLQGWAPEATIEEL